MLPPRSLKGRSLPYRRERRLRWRGPVAHRTPGRRQAGSGRGDTLKIRRRSAARRRVDATICCCEHGRAAFRCGWVSFDGEFAGLDRLERRELLPPEGDERPGVGAKNDARGVGCSLAYIEPAV